MLLTCRATVFSLMTSSVGDGAVGLARRDEREHLDLARRQAAGRRRPRRPDRCIDSSARASGAAPSCRNTCRAASSSIAAVSSSPSARQACPTSTRTRAASYGASSRCHAAPRPPQGGERGARLALGEQDGAVGPARHAPEQRRAEPAGDRASSSAAARAAATSPAASAISTYAASSRGRPRGPCLVDHAPHRRDRRGRPGPAPAAAAPGPAAAGAPAGWPSDTPPRPRRLAAQPVQLGLLVDGCPAAGSGGGRDSRSHARPASSSASGQAPCSCMISARWTRHCAAVRHEIRLRLAPAGQRRRPLLRAPQVEDPWHASITAQ